MYYIVIFLGLFFVIYQLDYKVSKGKDLCIFHSLFKNLEYRTGVSVHYIFSWMT